MKGLLIIANYNQELEIGPLLDRVERCHGVADAVVVDDGSTDRSASIAESKGFRTIRHGVNRGIGAAIRSGIVHAREHGYDFVTIMSANGKIQPEEIPEVSGPVHRNEADYVQGSRFLRGGDSRSVPTFRRFAIPLFTLLANLCLRRRFTDITCGFRAYKLSILDHPEVKLDQAWLDRYELEYYIHYWACRLGARIKEVPVQIVYSHLDRERRSKIRPIVGWWSMMRPFVYLTLRIRR